MLSGKGGAQYYNFNCIQIFKTIRPVFGGSTELFTPY